MKKIILLVALFSVIVTLTSCGKAEEAAVSSYFHAMQINDKDTMASMAVEPKDIEWKAFKITSTSEPVEMDLELPKLEKKLEELNKTKMAQVDIALEKKGLLDDAEFEIGETSRRTKKSELEQKVADLKAEVEAEEQKVKNIQAETNKLSQQIKVEKTMIGMSAGIMENYEMYTGKTINIKTIVNVTLTNGEIKDYVFLLRKDIMSMEDKARPSRYVITKIETVEDFDKMQQQKEENVQTQSQEVTEETTEQ